MWPSTVAMPINKQPLLNVIVSNFALCCFFRNWATFKYPIFYSEIEFELKKTAGKNAPSPVVSIHLPLISFSHSHHVPVTSP